MTYNLEIPCYGIALRRLEKRASEEREAQRKEELDTNQRKISLHCADGTSERE